MKKKERKPVLERYPRFPIARGIYEESIRWNVGVIVWYKRLIDATLGVVIIALIAFLMAAIFAFRQPLPTLYASALDGTLLRLPYSRTPNGELFEKIKERLILEEKDLASQGGVKVNVPKEIKEKQTPQNTPSVNPNTQPVPTQQGQAPNATPSAPKEEGGI